MTASIPLAVSVSLTATKTVGSKRRVRPADASCKPFADGIHSGMIKRFRHKGLETLFRTGGTKGVDPQLAQKLRHIPGRLNDGPLPDAMRLPGFRLHPLKGNRQGTWSVTVSANYRLTFEVEDNDATNVDLEDYH